MANHKSAKKRSKQSIKRNAVNKSLLKNVRNNISKYLGLISPDTNSNISSNNNDANEELLNSFRLVNSSLSKAVKKGVMKKKYASRKLSSLSKHLKKI